MGRRAHDADDREPPRVVRLAPTHVGHPDPRNGLPGVHESDPRSARRAHRRRALPHETAPSVWWTDPAEAFLPPDFACPNCAGTTFTKEMNIVDIWFESGVTHRAVLEQRGLPWPADVYLEGGDQYRGWFRSSLVTAVATKGHRPIRKSSRRAGWSIRTAARCTSRPATTSARSRAWRNTAPTCCACGSRRWNTPPTCASARNCSKTSRTSTATCATVSAGTSARSTISRPKRSCRAQRWNRSTNSCSKKLDAVARDIVVAYREFRLHDAYLALQRFDGDDLSAFYVDALKDRLYTSAPDSARRRSAQSAVLEIFRTIAVLTAPILSFTAEEAWQALPAALRGDNESVFDLAFPHIGARRRAALELWDMLKALRAQVAAAEGLRDFQLDAEVDVPPAHLDAVRALGDSLREALVVSTLRGIQRIRRRHRRASAASPAAGEKCERCWKYLPLGSDPDHPTLCTRAPRSSTTSVPSVIRIPLVQPARLITGSCSSIQT